MSVRPDQPLAAALAAALDDAALADLADRLAPLLEARLGRQVQDEWFDAKGQLRQWRATVKRAPAAGNANRGPDQGGMSSMAGQEVTPTGGPIPAVSCVACGSPIVVAMDSTGAPCCLRHRAMEIESLEVQRDLGTALLENVVSFVVEEEGMLHPDDALAAVGEAIQVAAENRRGCGLRVVPTIAETLQAADALHEYETLGSNGEEG